MWNTSPRMLTSVRLVWAKPRNGESAGNAPVARNVVRNVRRSIRLLPLRHAHGVSGLRRLVGRFHDPHVLQVVGAVGLELLPRQHAVDEVALEEVDAVGGEVLSL